MGRNDPGEKENGARLLTPVQSIPAMTAAAWSPPEPAGQAWRTGVQSPHIHHVAAYQIITMMELKHNMIIFMTRMPI